MSVLFWAEILIGAVIPMVLFSFKQNPPEPEGLLIGAIILLLGMILNRFDVSWFAVKHPDPLTYCRPLWGQCPLLPIAAGSAGFGRHLLGRHPGLWPGGEISAGV